jgi:signal transduction histidine kinase
MRIRMKLMLLHTGFSLGLAAILLIALRPAIGGVVEQAELNEARVVLGLAIATDGDPAASNRVSPDVTVRVGTAEELGVPDAVAAAARASPGQTVPAPAGDDRTAAVAFEPDAGGIEGKFWLATVRIPEARAGVLKLYGLVAVALLAIYGLVAAALELFVLPQNVYGPIRRLLVADQALQHGRREQELVPESEIPADELGEIMRSRNESVRALRAHERALGEALAELERVATDLKRKNHLLEAARRNLADADRLASLGMMSAGIAHELNTPLAVLKGLVERLNAEPTGKLPRTQAALMLRVVGRLERLGESLLDFARVRPPRTRPTALRAVVDEAVTLLRLDRDAAGVEFNVTVPDGLVLECDADRMLQVFVNLLRNAAEACRPRGGEGRVEIRTETTAKEGRDWASITISDNGPGIDADMLSRLFEPFASTRLDAHGTGLGLAVAEGIVREHGGLILARNRTDGGGAVFEVVVPLVAAPYPASDSAPAPGEPAAAGDAG